MIPTLILFWLFVTVVAVSWTWTTYLARLASEKTIRQAIDRGVILDAETIDRLRPRRRTRWDLLLILLGTLVLFTGLGIALFGILLALDSPDALFPVLAIAAIPTLSGAGLLVAGFWLHNLPRD